MIEERQIDVQDPAPTILNAIEQAEGKNPFMGEGFLFRPFLALTYFPVDLYKRLSTDEPKRLKQFISAEKVLNPV